MQKPLRNIYVTGLFTLMVFFSVAYTACSKGSEPAPSKNECSTVNCKNGGSCFNGSCTCNAGFEGTLCEYESIERYLGTWSVSEKIVGSSVDSLRGKLRTYTCVINKQEATKFVIDDLTGRPEYDGVPGSIGIKPGPTGVNIKAGSTDFVLGSKAFVQDTNRTQVMYGSGHITDGGKFMTGTYIINYISNQMPVYDTIVFDAIR